MESQSDSEQEIQEIIDLEIAEFRDVNGGLSQKHPQFKNISDTLHARYIETLKQLHKKFQPMYGDAGDQVLEIITSKEAKSPELQQ